MIDPHIFQTLILTNTVVAIFCIVLLIAFIVFILVILVPSIRQRWFGNNEKEENPIIDKRSLSSLSRQPSFHNVSLGSSRFNPIFEPASGAATTTTTTQFGTLFHPQATTATLLHPTIWTSMNPTSVLSSPLSIQPPPPSHPPTTTSASSTATTTPQRSPKKR
jgi:hypothetical protein